MQDFEFIFTESNKHFPTSNMLVKEFDKVLKQYSEGAILSIEAIAKIFEVLQEHYEEISSEYVVLNEQLSKLNKD